MVNASQANFGVPFRSEALQNCLVAAGWAAELFYCNLVQVVCIRTYTCMGNLK